MLRHDDESNEGESFMWIIEMKITNEEQLWQMK